MRRGGAGESYLRWGRLAIGVFVSFDEFEQDDFLPLVVDIIQNPVWTDTQSVFCSEL